MTRLVVLFLVDLFPAVRTTQRQKFFDPAYAKYHASKIQIRAATLVAMSEQGIEQFDREPLRLALFINVPKAMHRRDLSNILKGVEDSAQHVAFPNDAWIDEIATTRRLVPDQEQRAVMIVQPTREGPTMFSEWVAQAEEAAREQGVIT